jgi:hypothetical protein
VESYGHIASVERIEYSPPDVLVHARQPVRLDEEPSLLLDLATQAGRDRLIEF